MSIGSSTYWLGVGTGCMLYGIVVSGATLAVLLCRWECEQEQVTPYM